VDTAKGFNGLLEELSGYLLAIDARDMSFRLKSDGSPVSDFDIRVEDVVVNLLNSHLPGFQLIAEESYSGNLNQESGNVLVLDPIDGTENFIAGIPVWATGLALYVSGRLWASCVFFPELRMIAKTKNAVFPAESRFRAFRENVHATRVVGFSSNSDWSEAVKKFGTENRIFGCSLFNLTVAANSGLRFISSSGGVRIWDIAPALALALERGMTVKVNGGEYHGELLDACKYHVVEISHP
jgi:myo-inositol-1(or 4)-monophosphatase